MPQTILPDLDDPEWNETRVRLQDEIGNAAERLLDHMVSPGGFRGTFDFETADGRIIHLVIEAGERPRGN